MKLYQYNEILNTKTESFETISSYQMELISIFLDMDLEEIKLKKVHEIKEELQKINEIFKSSKGSPEEIEIEYKVKLKRFESLSLGEYIDLSNYLINKEFHKMLAILYVKTSHDDLSLKPKYEDYDMIDINERSKSFQNLNVIDIFGTVENFIKFREKIIKSYANLFNVPTEDEDIVEDTAEEKLHAQFAWESLILYLANGDVTKFNEVTSLPVLFTFNIASFKKGVEIQNNKIKK